MPGFWLILLFIVALIDFFLDIRGRDAFTWMDPEQYYGFAEGLVQGTRGFRDFELPSIFPYFVAGFLKVSLSVPGALWVNAFFMAVLLYSIYQLCRELDIPWLAPLVGIAVLASPLLLGLSRSLFTEYALAAIVALQYALWLKSNQFKRRTSTLIFSLLFAIGLMTSMKYSLFFVGPFALTFLLSIVDRDYRVALRQVLVFLVPAIAVAAIEYFVFSKSWAYYRSMGNTAIPIMYLVGPLERFSFASISYYFLQIWKTMLLLVAPFLLAGLFRRPAHWSWPDRRALILWAWALTPMIILIFQPVKEPRHIAPCVLPLALLAVRFIGRLEFPKLRWGLGGLLLVVCVGQYWGVTQRRIETPYFMDRAAKVGEIGEWLVRADPRAHEFVNERGFFDQLRWIYSKNIAIAGFEPNMALLLAWQFSPAVIYDLDLMDEGSIAGSGVAYDRFEDLFFYEAFNIFNRRCLWPRHDFTLDRDTVVANADFLIVGNLDEDELTVQYPRHALMTSLVSGREKIHILAMRQSVTKPYRVLYGREFLKRGRQLEEADLNAIYFDLSINALLRKDFDELERIFQERPPAQIWRGERRNIYWTGKARQLQGAAASIYRGFLARGTQRE